MQRRIWLNGETIMKYKVAVGKCDEGWYTTYVPALKGCSSEGETVEEALRNIKEAIRDYLDVMEEIIKEQKNYEVEVG